MSKEKKDQKILYTNFSTNNQPEPGTGNADQIDLKEEVQYAEKKQNRITFLCSVNNWIVSSMIEKFCSLLGSNLSVLDLCCGKGGDLVKYLKQKVKLYVGSDISKDSLETAMIRLEKIITEKYGKDFQTKCIFVNEDLSAPNNSLLEKVPQTYYFDLVSCQFGIHYHFESEERLKTFLSNVSSRLSKGGYFIGSIIDEDELLKKFKIALEAKDKNCSDDVLTLGNDFFSLKFSQKELEIKKGPFGVKYGFYLEGSIGEKDQEGNIDYVDEFKVDFKEFVEICKNFGLYLVERKNFKDFYQEYLKEDRYKQLSEKLLKDIDNDNVNAQWEIIQLYTIFIFRKGDPKENEKEKYVPYLTRNKIEFKDYASVFEKGIFV